MQKTPKRPKKTSNKEYSTGYARPPMHTRWKKGESGNPKGRPGGRKNRATLFLEILNRKIEVNEKGKVRMNMWFFWPRRRGALAERDMSGLSLQLRKDCGHTIKGSARKSRRGYVNADVTPWKIVVGGG